jgi:hypothetical protein
MLGKTKILPIKEVINDPKPIAVPVWQQAFSNPYVLPPMSSIVKNKIPIRNNSINTIPHNIFTPKKPVLVKPT